MWRGDSDWCVAVNDKFDLYVRNLGDGCEDTREYDNDGTLRLEHRGFIHINVTGKNSYSLDLFE